MSPHFQEVSVFPRSCKDPSQRIAVENSATGKPITTIQAGDTSTTIAAIEAAKAAFEDWRWRSSTERGALLLECADELAKHREELAELLCLENGKPYQDALIMDVMFLVGIFQYFGSLVDKLPSQFYDKGNMYCAVVRDPFGVCAGILPFNWPPNHTGGNIAPAIACGNTMII